jgi:uncharacterized Zn finger protein
MTPSISETTIHHHATDPSFRRGEDYYHRGAVVDLVQRGNTLHAQVEGTEVAPYRVSLQFDSAGITSVDCTCAYDYAGWCKHIVAAALTWVRHPDRVELRPTLPQLLDRLDHRQTQRLVQILVEEQPDLIDRVDLEVMLMSNPVEPAATPRRRTTLDVAPFRRQVQQILREGVRSLENGYEEDPFTDDLETVIEKAQAFARSEDGNSAIAILDAITGACVDEWDDITEYGGEYFPIVESLNQAWTEAILSADLSPAEAIDLQVMLEEWHHALGGDFSMSLAALEQGWTDPGLQRALQGQDDSAPDFFKDSFANDFFAQDLALIRLQILDRQGRQQEYLNLAHAAGLQVQYLTRLVEVGKIEEAMTTARSHMATAEEAFALAKTLRENNYLSEALAIAQAGLPLPGDCRYPLASWTSELAEGCGDRAIALEASILAFKLRPSFSDYQRAALFAATDWDSIQPDLLTALRQFQEWGGQAAKVDIFLHEGLLEDAIQAVRSDTYYGSETVHRVMKAVLSTHPDWVIEAARKRAEPIMEQGKADRYNDAVQWLQQVKAAYIQSDQQAIWTTYFNQLQQSHARKRKLMELFKQLR